MAPLEIHTSREIGESEETRTLNYFLEKGWKILIRNYRCCVGEIDLIFKDAKDSIVFVEVKYRSSSNYGVAQSSVGAQKQSRLIKTALFFIKENHLQKWHFRFDVAAVTPQGIEHIPNAFQSARYTF